MKMFAAKKPAFIFLFVITCFTTSISAQTITTIPDSVVPQTIAQLPAQKKYLSVKSLAVPAAFIGFGFAAAYTDPFRQINRNISKGVQQSMPGFETKVDDYLKHAPAITFFALSATGAKSKHQLLGKTIIFLVSTELCSELIKRLKGATNQLRPDGSTYNSFPSGHTATAFVGAEMIHQEYGHLSPWYSVAGYSLAGSTGLLRVLNNRHWLGDVIAGAGIGILSTKVGYWLFSKIEKKKEDKKLSY